MRPTRSLLCPVAFTLLLLGCGSVQARDAYPSPRATSHAASAPAFAWSELLVSARSAHAAVYDPVRQRMLVFGGFAGPEGPMLHDVWALSLAGVPSWAPLAVAGTPPYGRAMHSAVYDPVRDRVLVFGGWDGDYNRFSNEVWALSLQGTPTWTKLSTAGTLPPGRAMHSAIYDPVRDRMVVFGGLDISYNEFSDVWTLSLSGRPTWSALSPAGGAPSGRGGHSAIYDPVRDRMLVFGGWEPGSSIQHNDVWALSLAGSPNWTLLAPAGTPPDARSFHTAIYDPLRDRMVVCGGSGNSGIEPDVWALDLAGTPGWTRLAVAGTAPTPRAVHTAIYDPTSDRMVIFGGTDSTQSSHNDAWALSLANPPAWTALGATRIPGGRRGHVAIHDPARARMVVFGGYDDSYAFSGYWNDVWQLSLGDAVAWSELAAGGTPPPGREGAAAIYDPVRDQLVMFGGRDGFGSYRNDLWMLSLGDPPAWTQHAPAGTPPSARSDCGAFYDPAGDRMVVFGGIGADGEHNEVWALSLAGTLAWTELVPLGTPPSARYGASAVWDAARSRAVIFGGSAGYMANDNDVWALSLGEVPAWTALAPLGSPPSPRFGHSAVVDSEHDRMLVFGGFDGMYEDDAWALSLAGTPAWSALPGDAPPPTPRQGHSAVYDPTLGRMILFGGVGYGAGADLAYRNDLWEARRGEGPVGGELALDGLFPHPGHDLTVNFTLPDASPARLEAFDLAGRRIATREVGSLGAGSHAVDLGAGMTLRSGVYFVRLTRAGRELTGRAVVIR